MKKVLIIMLALLVTLTFSYGFSSAQMGSGMMSGSDDEGGHMMTDDPDEETTPSGYGYGMGPGYGYGYGMGPGMMGGYGMMHHGRGGYGMGGACGMMGGYGWDNPDMKKFLDDTVDLRRQIHAKMFDYMEASRNPDTSKEDLKKLAKELRDLQKKLWEKRKEVSSK